MLTNYRTTISLLSRDARLLLLTVIVVGFSYMGVYVTLFNLYLLRLDMARSSSGRSMRRRS